MKDARPLSYKKWLWEIAGIFFSLLCFVAIVSILAVFDGKTAPNFAYGFTLNAIVSILGTASKTSLIYVIGECIGQLKWIWFYKAEKRQLDEMQLFDNASRGPLGSLFVLLQHKGRSLVSLGAIVTILALMFDPFMQQLVTYPTRQAVAKADSSDATAKQAFFFYLNTETSDFQAMVSTGIWAESPDQLKPNVTCSSGNCEWEAFESVGICSQCEDITSLTKLECRPLRATDTTLEQNSTDCEIIPPQGESANLTVDAMIEALYFMGEGSYYPSLTLEVPDQQVWSPFHLNLTERQDGVNETYAGIRAPLSVIAHARLTLANNTITGLSPLSDLANAFRVDKATQCALGLCLRRYQVSVTNGTASFEASEPDFGQRVPRPNHAFPECWEPTRGLPPETVNLTDVPNESEFSFCGVDTYNLKEYVEGYSWRPYQAANLSEWELAGLGLPSNNPAAEKIINNGLEAIVGNLAASLTKGAFSMSDSTVNGRVYVSEVYISVDWLWLLFPGALVTLGLLFLLLTILTNNQQSLHPWKTSMLAVLFHGLNGLDTETTDHKVMTTDQMEKTAQGIQVRLREVDQRKCLMLDRS
ncbi:DUF3176 domain-containing protein [Aspergillus undulatus]|uniref:DUF3176 domain-containing protein n=1 Tax=Aspergillus undulatus TaxID=1810928 RepID=UPI003CCE4B9D